MNKNYTLKELADIGAKAAYSCMPDGVRMCVLNGAPPHHVVARQAFTKAVLDAIGYELPKDEEREAFERWLKFAGWDLRDSTFEAWKAGREELRRAQAVPVCATNTDAKSKEPAWIPWAGGECPLPDTVKRWEIKAKDGAVYLTDRKPSTYLWWHSERDGFSQENIVAYRVWE